MDMRAVASAIAKMFPSLNLNSVLEKAQQQMSGTSESLESVSQTARRLGINQVAINEIYNRIGQSPQARIVCKMLGTTPEQLKADADKIVGESGPASQPVKSMPAAKTKFPRLK